MHTSPRVDPLKTGRQWIPGPAPPRRPEAGVCPAGPAAPSARKSEGSGGRAGISRQREGRPCGLAVPPPPRAPAPTAPQCLLALGGLLLGQALSPCLTCHPPACSPAGHEGACPSRSAARRSRPLQTRPSPPSQTLLWLLVCPRVNSKGSFWTLLPLAPLPLLTAYLPGPARVSASGPLHGLFPLPNTAPPGIPTSWLVECLLRKEGLSGRKLAPPSPRRSLPPSASFS